MDDRTWGVVTILVGIFSPPLAETATVSAMPSETITGEATETATAVPPWFRYVVGAPKKQVGEERI